MPSMKVKKGDVVQMLAGKDRGKQGRVLDARPSDRQVIVETRPLSKLKRWRLAEIVEKAK